MSSAVLAGVSVAASAIGAGVSYFASTSAAKSQEAIGIANAQMQGDAARNQSAQQQMALKFQKLQQDAIAQGNLTQAQALIRQSEAATKAAQENIRRQREQFESLVSQQYAALGQAGVSAVTGSPIDILMANAAAEQEQEMVMRDEDEERRRQAVRDANALQSNSFAARINSNLLGLEAGAARAQGKMGMAQSRLNAASTTASARGMRYQAVGDAFGNAAGIGYDAYSFRNNFKTVS